MGLVRHLEDGAANASISASADRQQLEDTCRHVESLQSDLQGIGALLRRTREEVADQRLVAQQQTGLVSSVADSLAALEHGLSNTDAEIADVRTFLHAPYPGESCLQHAS